MKYLMVFFLTLSLMANPTELLIEVFQESATTPKAKMVVQAFVEKLEAQKALEVARHQENLKLARGGKMIYARVHQAEIKKQLTLLEQ